MTTVEVPVEAQRDSRTGVGHGVPVDAALAWLLAFAPTVYLALSGGGYDVIARSEVGIVLWWVVLLGVIVGVFPRRHLRLRAWIALGLLGGFFIWSRLAAGWSQSEEQTLAESARVASYLGVFVLGLCLMTRVGARAMLFGLAAAITLVSALAVLSKLVPSWFPADSTASLYATSRLRYPFDYSDGVGEFAALGVPLLMWVATGARTLVSRALGAAGLPVLVLCLAMTVSRGGLASAVIGLVVFFCLVPDRLPRLLTAVLAAAAGAVEIAALVDRPGLRNTLLGSAPAGQRHSMLVIAILTALVMALLQAGVVLASRRISRPRMLTFSRRGAAGAGYVLLSLFVIGVATLIATGGAAHLWREFRQPNPTTAGNSYFRLFSLSGSLRYQYWQVAIQAFHTSPLKGIGPGTFQFYWAQHQTVGQFVRNAHSLWIETLAETGIVGLILIGGFFLFVLVTGSLRAARLPTDLRLPVSTAVAGVAVFCTAAAFDWVWQIGVIPLIALFLAAVVLGSVHHRPRRTRTRWWGTAKTRIVLAVAALVALWAIVVPLAATISVRASQSAVRAGKFGSALSDAATAANIEPGAASPRLQRALVLEQLGDITAASGAISQAEQREPTNWEIWLVASRIATEAGHARLALTDYVRARSLNPTSPIFARQG